MSEFDMEKMFGFLRLHIRCKELSKLSDFKSQARGGSATATTAHNISRTLTDIDSMEISMGSKDPTLQPQHVMSPTEASGHSSGLGLVHTDENHAVIIPLAKAGDNNMCSLLQLSGIGGAGIRGERHSDI